MKFSSVVAWSMMLAGALAVPQARADVYTWTDSAGRMNISNLDPPEGARVSSVIRTKARTAKDAADDSVRQTELAALSRRVRELEDEVEVSRQQSTAMPPAPPVVYQIIQPAPPVIVNAQAIVVPGSPALQGNYGCDPSWAGCALWWGPGFVTNTFVGRPPAFRHFNGFNRRGFVSRPPMRPPGFAATMR